jgi:hypothetical protein
MHIACIMNLIENYWLWKNEMIRDLVEVEWILIGSEWIINGWIY